MEYREGSPDGSPMRFNRQTTLAKRGGATAGGANVNLAAYVKITDFD